MEIIKTDDRVSAPMNVQPNFWSPEVVMSREAALHLEIARLNSERTKLKHKLAREKLRRQLLEQALGQTAPRPPVIDLQRLPCPRLPAVGRLWRSCRRAVTAPFAKQPPSLFGVVQDESAFGGTTSPFLECPTFMNESVQRFLHQKRTLPLAKSIAKHNVSAVAKGRGGQKKRKNKAKSLKNKKNGRSLAAHTSITVSHTSIKDDSFVPFRPRQVYRHMRSRTRCMATFGMVPFEETASTVILPPPPTASELTDLAQRLESLQFPSEISPPKLAKINRPKNQRISYLGK